MCKITNVSVTRKPCCRGETARCRCDLTRWRPAAFLNLIEPEIAPFNPPTPKSLPERNMKWIVAEIWPFKIQHITRIASGTPCWGKGRSKEVINRTTGKSDDGFLYALHCDRCAISNHSATICHWVSATLNSTGGGGTLGQNFRVFPLDLIRNVVVCRE